MAWTLKDTERHMESTDYKERFFAEYMQTKIRYEKLKAYCNKIEASFITEGIIPEPPHNCPLDLLREQQGHMGRYLHSLEIRAIIEGINIGQEVHADGN